MLPDEKVRDNIVILILESFSAEYWGAGNGGNRYTPFLDSLASKFDAAKYHDEYRDCVMQMLRKKAHGEEIVVEHPREKKPAKTSAKSENSLSP